MDATTSALRRAHGEIGYHEGPNNDTKFGKYYGLNHEPWCAMFVSWCYATSKPRHPLPAMQAGMSNGYAAVASGINWAKAHGLFIPSWHAQPGDAICYGWDGTSSSPENMHTGLVVSGGPRGSLGHTIEGNRGDQVGRFTFVVGSDVVLGCIDLNRLMNGRPKVQIAAPKPDPQPRPRAHPHHTGPAGPAATPHAPAPAKRRRRGKRHGRRTITVTRAWLIDTTERAGATFVETFAGLFGLQGLAAAAGGNWHTVATLAHSAEGSAAAAALAVVKAAFAAKRKGTASPASLVKTT